MKHRETIALLDDYDNDGLDAPSRSAVEAHLAWCEDCMKLTKVYRALADAATSESTHPSAEDVVAYAMHRDDLEDARRGAIEAHVAGCEQCVAELQHVQRVEAAAGAGQRRPKSGSRFKGIGPTGWLAAAALVAAALLVYPSYLGLVRLPAVSNERRMTAFDGPVSFFVLTPATRGEETRTQVEIQLGQPVVLLAFELLVPRSVAAEETLHFELRPGDEQPVWSHDSGVREVRSTIKARGVLTLAIPTTDLSTGRHELIVSHSGTPEVPLAVLPFDISVTR